MNRASGSFMERLSRWNKRRLRRRHFHRELLLALAEDDAAIMDSLARLHERQAELATALEGRTSAIMDSLARLHEGQAELAQDDAAIMDPLARLREGQAELAEDDAAIMDSLARLRERQAELAAVLERRTAAAIHRLDELAASGRAVGGSSANLAFPLVSTARSELLDPEVEVLAHIAKRLDPKLAFDVGAHHGVFSAALLDLGFEVHAVEPNPAVCAELRRRLGMRAGLTVHPVAAGSRDGEAELGLVAAPGLPLDPSTLGSVAGLPVPAGLERAETLRVPLRRLDTLIAQHRLGRLSLVKVDTEGYDLEVLRGLGAAWPDVLQAEFWDADFPWSSPDARNRLTDLVSHARSQGAGFHLAVFRRWGEDRPAFFANYSASPERSWGNVIFFKDRALFEDARQHLVTLLPEARFAAASGREQGG